MLDCFGDSLLDRIRIPSLTNQIAAFVASRDHGKVNAIRVSLSDADSHRTGEEMLQVGGYVIKWSIAFFYNMYFIALVRGNR